MKGKSFLAWLPGIPIAIVNGALREQQYRRFLSELRAHQLSGMSFIVLFGAYVWFVVAWLRLSSASQALRLGLYWLLLTVAFEFVFGHLVMGQTWGALLHDYNVFAGRVWVFVLIWIAAAPSLVFRLQRRRSRPAA